MTSSADTTEELSDISRVNRLYAVLGRVNEAIIRIRAEQDLFEEACKIAVKDGGFALAWIGFVEPETQRIRVSARYGRDEGYLDAVKISLRDDVPEGRGPTGVAMREGRPFVNNDTANNPVMGPWRAEQVRRGFLSSASFPLRIAGGTIGVITLYADTTDYFDREEVHLLTALADDFSFALEAAQVARKKAAAEEALRRSHDELEARVKRRTAELARELARTKVLMEVASQSARSLEPGELGERILEVARRLLGATHGSVYLVDQQAEATDRVAEFGFPQEAPMASADLAIVDDLAGRAIVTGRVQISEAQTVPPSSSEPLLPGPRPDGWSPSPQGPTPGPMGSSRLASPRRASSASRRPPSIRQSVTSSASRWRTSARFRRSAISQTGYRRRCYRCRDRSPASSSPTPTALRLKRHESAATSTISSSSKATASVCPSATSRARASTPRCSLRWPSTPSAPTPSRGARRRRRSFHLTNQVIHEATPPESFVTIFFATIDLGDGTLTCANAGHTAAAVVHRDGTITSLPRTGPPAGAFEGVQFGLAEARLGRGELLFLYSDGLTEARRGDEFYGEERLFALLSKVDGGPQSVLTTSPRRCHAVQRWRPTRRHGRTCLRADQTAGLSTRPHQLVTVARRTGPKQDHLAAGPVDRERAVALSGLIKWSAASSTPDDLDRATRPKLDWQQWRPRGPAPIPATSA